MTPSSISLKEMASHALHFGHPTDRWNPKMKPYLYGKRHGIHIFDLQKSAQALAKALQYLNDLAAKKKTVLLVGTKQQARKGLEAIHQSTHMPVVINKWMPGLLTNFKTIKGRIRYFVTSKEEDRTGELTKYTKKEQVKKRKEIQSLNIVFSGVEQMTDLPDAVFVADVVRDNIAVKEARRLAIPVVGITDSNADPDLVDYPIPANDDAVKSVDYILGLVQEALTVSKKQPETPSSETPSSEVKVGETELSEKTKA